MSNLKKLRPFSKYKLSPIAMPSLLLIKRFGFVASILYKKYSPMTITVEITEFTPITQLPVVSKP